MGNESSQQLQNQIINLRINAKQLERASKKCEKLENAEKAKIKKALEAGNQEVGRIHAENAIRQHSQSINFLKLAARLDSVASRLKSVQTAQLMGKNLENVSKVMGVAMQRMNLERNFDVLESFDKQCNELDTQMNILEGAMSQSTATLTPDNQVEALMQQVADEHGLDVSISLNQIGLPNANTVAQTSTQTKIDKTRTVDEEMKS